MIYKVLYIILIMLMIYKVVYIIVIKYLHLLCKWLKMFSIMKSSLFCQLSLWCIKVNTKHFPMLVHCWSCWSTTLGQPWVNTSCLLMFQLCSCSVMTSHVANYWRRFVICEDWCCTIVLLTRTKDRHIPLKSSQWSHDVLMLCQRRRRWSNMKTTLDQHI